MIKYLFILLSALTLNSTAVASMADDFEYYQRNPEAELPMQVRSVLNRYQFLFVGGFMNELARSHYFDLNVQTLKEMGVTDVNVFFPSSAKAASHNRFVLRNEIQRLFTAGDAKPVIVIGHSKGGLESLATVLMDPELIDAGIIAEVVLLQAPIGGNSMVDHQGILHRVFAKSLFFAQGFNSLMTTKIRSVIENRLAELSESEVRTLSSSVKYVVSGKSLDESANILKFSRSFAPIKGPNDGLVARDDMWLPGFGTVIGDLPADHLEVVIGKSSFLGGKVMEARVRAFTKSLALNIAKGRTSKKAEFVDLTRSLLLTRSAPLACHLAILAK